MRHAIRFDIYTILMIAIVPFFLATAWGLTWNNERVMARQACEDTESYLVEAAEIASLFTDAGTLDDADTWLDQLATISPHGHAWDLHQSASRTVEYAMNTQPDLGTEVPGIVYERIMPFRIAIDNAQEKIADKCPDLAVMVPDAFPMLFTKEP
jgi:hypothetical protein